MDRHPVAISAATGSISSTLFFLLRDLFTQAPGPTPPPTGLPLDFSCPVCPEPPPINFWCGVVVGFALWPLLELLVLVKQWLTLAVKARIAAFGLNGKLYRVLG